MQIETKGTSKWNSIVTGPETNVDSQIPVSIRQEKEDVLIAIVKL